MISKETKFCIVGLGLLGGSIAQGLKQKGYNVSAVDIHEESIEFALEKKWIDSGSVNPIDVITEADFIILALYPTLVEQWIVKNQKHFKSGCIVTDVTGVKSEIVPLVESIIRDDIEYISCHPMAGKEVSGVKFSDSKMFEVANFIITPTSKNSLEAVTALRDFASILSFRQIVECSIKEHDEMIGFLSQLTHVIAVTLMNTDDHTNLVKFTGDSFRDLTRIASINENLWSELFLMNKEILLEKIDAFSKELKHFYDTLEAEDESEMKRLFIQSTQRRKLFDK